MLHLNQYKKYFMLMAVLAINESVAKNEGPFKVVRTVNVGYPQNKLPTRVLINGEPNPCYFQQEVFNASTTIHHGAAVEPSIAVNPKNPHNIVTIWQQDRIDNSGSLEIGIAYTFDNGETWKRTEVPFQICNGGIIQRATNGWLSFSPEGKLFLSALAFNASPSSQTQNQIAVVVSISEDGGKTWSLPQSVVQSSYTLSGPFFLPVPDKPSITSDPNHHDNTYVVWDQQPNGDLFYVPTFFSRTTDGGKTWTPGALSYDLFPDLCAQGLSTCDPAFLAPFGEDAPGEETYDNAIVVLPEAQPCTKQWQKDHFGNDANKEKRFSGHLLNFKQRIFPPANATAEEYFNDNGPLTFFFSLIDFAVVRSQDQGANWNGTATVVIPNTDFAGNAGADFIMPLVYTGGYTYDVNGNPAGGMGTLLRTAAEGVNLAASYNANRKNGFLYTVYQTPQFRSDFLPQIGITTSRDGGYTWSERVRINQTPQNAPNPQAFTPFVAVTKDGYVGILYADLRNDPVAVPNTSATTLVDAWLAIYKEVKDPKGGSTGIGLDFVQELRLSPQSFIAQNGPTTNTGVMIAGDNWFLTTHKNTFYAAWTQSTNGPFTPATLFFSDPANNATVFLDDNLRQLPIVSIIEFCKKGEEKQ